MARAEEFGTTVRVAPKCDYDRIGTVERGNAYLRTFYEMLCVDLPNIKSWTFITHLFSLE